MRMLVLVLRGRRLWKLVKGCAVLLLMRGGCFPPCSWGERAQWRGLAKKMGGEDRESD